jgi:hypothetical protein
MKVACTVRSGGKRRKPHSRQRLCGTNNIRHREMLDDIYILLAYVETVNNKILNVVTSCVIREIVTYHYISLIWIMILSLIIKERRCKKPLLRQASQCSLYVAKLGNIALQQWQIHYNRCLSSQVRLFRRTFLFYFLVICD